MKNMLVSMMFLLSVTFLFSAQSDASERGKDRGRRSAHNGYGLYLGLTPFYERSPARHRFLPHLLPHAHLGSPNPSYHHRGNIITRRRGYGIGVGIRYGIFRSHNLGLGIHLR
jgi:hypothetical protein